MDLYQTKSRDEFAIAGIESRNGLEIVKFGVPNLTLENRELMTELLANLPLESASSRLSLEVTPMRVKVGITRNDDRDLEREGLIGREFDGYMVRIARGPHSREYLLQLLHYERSEQIRRVWKFFVFWSRFKEESDSRSSVLSAVAEVDEPLLEAFEKRKFVEVRDLDSMGAPRSILPDERSD